MKAVLRIAIVIACFPVTQANAQSINKARLDSLFDLLAANDKAMASIALSQDGEIVYSRAIGYKVINEKIPADTKTKYKIGSITKTFTATIIFQLIEEKKLELTTTLDKYFPQFPNADKINIGHMLSHRSGLFNFTNDPTFPSWVSQSKTMEELLAIMAKPPVDFQPDEKTAYSNTNYVLLGYIIEKITKQPYAEALQKRILSKVKLKDTYCGGKIDVKQNEAFSHRYTSKWEQVPEWDMTIPGAAGMLVSTPSDLTKFIEALFGGKLVSNASLEQMKTIRQGMGMGMFQVPFNDKKGYGHNGGIEGFSSNLFYFPEDKLALAYCSNGAAFPINDIMIGVLSIYFNVPYKLPDFTPQPVVADVGDLNKYVGVYSTTAMPLKITVTNENNTLSAQATGQSAFPLSPSAANKFKFDPAGIVMEFDPDKGEMVLNQGGGRFVFTREK